MVWWRRSVRSCALPEQRRCRTPRVVLVSTCRCSSVRTPPLMSRPEPVSRAWWRRTPPPCRSARRRRRDVAVRRGIATAVTEEPAESLDRRRSRHAPPIGIAQRHCGQLGPVVRRQRLRDDPQQGRREPRSRSASAVRKPAIPPPTMTILRAVPVPLLGELRALIVIDHVDFRSLRASGQAFVVRASAPRRALPNDAAARWRRPSGAAARVQARVRVSVAGFASCAVRCAAARFPRWTRTR